MCPDRQNLILLIWEGHTFSCLRVSKRKGYSHNTKRGNLYWQATDWYTVLARDLTDERYFDYRSLLIRNCKWVLKLVLWCRDSVQTGLKIWDIFVSISCNLTLRVTEEVFCFLVNSPVYIFLYQSLWFDSVSFSLRNRAFFSNPRAPNDVFSQTGGGEENSWIGKLTPNENYSINFRKRYC